MPSHCLILCHSLLLLPSIFPSIRVYSSESVLHIRWPNSWSFSFNISPSNEYSGMISIRMDWLGLLAVQGTLKSLLQHHSSKASILLCSVFFIVQLSHPHMTTGKTIALTRQTFVGKVMFQLFNMLSTLVIAFLPRSLLKCISIESVMLFNHLILCCPLLLLPSVFSSIRVFSNALALHIRWPKDWSFNFSISPSSEHSELISLKINWFNLLAVKGIHKILLQDHSSKASVLWCSVFFMVQLSHLCMTTGKIVPLTVWTSVRKVMSLLFITLYRFVIAFLPRSKYLLISWLQSPSAVILDPKKIKSP